MSQGAGQSVAVRGWERGAYLAIASVFVWTRLTSLQTSISGDQIATVLNYVNPGPAGFYSTSHYLPNNHVLFSLLTWLTTGVLGREPPTYRVWSVVPAILAVAILVWWTRRRFGRITALVLAAIFLTAPYLLSQTVEARGYGLMQLGIVLVIVAALELEEHGVRRWPLAVLGLGVFIGPATIDITALGAAFAIIWLVRRPDLRRPVLRASLLGALACVVLLAPVLPTMIKSQTNLFAGTGRPAAVQLKYPSPPADAVLTGTVNLGAYTGQLLFTGTAKRACYQLCYTSSQLVEWGGPMFAAAILGAAVLWWRRRRGLLGCLLSVIFGSWVSLTVLQISAADRFMLFLLPAYALLAAIGVGELVYRLLRAGAGVRVPVAVMCAGLLAFGAVRIYRFSEGDLLQPGQDFAGLADAVANAGVATVFTNAPSTTSGLLIYIHRPVRFLEPAPLERLLCDTTRPIVFAQITKPITLQDAGCLARRHASSEDFRHGVLRLWLIDTPGTPAITEKAIS